MPGGFVGILCRETENTMAKTKRTFVNFSELEGFRYLHFGSEWIQGGMQIARPWKLALEYQQWMMTLMLFQPNPQEILQLGLGAGGFAKFCWKYFPDANTKVVEISEDVYMAARMWFRMPADDDHLEVVFEDCKKFLGNRKAYEAPDWLLVDIYDAECWGPVYDDVPFYKLCRRSMNKPGYATFNVFGGEDFRRSLDHISEAFDGRVLFTPEVQEGNRIIIAATGPKQVWDAAELQKRGEAFRKAYKLPADKWVKALQKENGLGDTFEF